MTDISDQGPCTLHLKFAACTIVRKSDLVCRLLLFKCPGSWAARFSFSYRHCESFSGGGQTCYVAVAAHGPCPSTM